MILAPSRTGDRSGLALLIPSGASLRIEGRQFDTFTIPEGRKRQAVSTWAELNSSAARLSTRRRS
jgi:hypothetical protein